MTPKRMARLVARWVRFYTRGLPTPIAERRIGEIEADLRDHIAYECEQGTTDRRVAFSIVSRMARGLAADASWRRQHPRATPAGYRSAVVVACILLLPLVAMQFTEEVAWNLADFVVAGVLLFGAGLTYELVARQAGNLTYRVALGVAVASALMLVWLVGAVGVIGEEGDRADLMYGGVLTVGIVGAFIARFRPLGMARVLVAMSIAQALVAVIALIAGKHQAPITSAVELLGLNAFFVALFIGSAWLFRAAARKPHSGAV